MTKKLVLITGGCQGLGKEIASLLNSKHEVVIISNNKATLEKTSKELDVKSHLCDITNPEGIEKVIGEYKKIDILINNAGVLVGKILDETEYSDIAKVMLINTVGTINMTKAVIPIMKKQQSGKIVNISSVDGIEAKKERSVYIASKWGVTGFTRAIREELQDFGISVMGLYPGLIKTNLHKTAKVKRDFTNAMDPKEVAQVVKFVISYDDIVFEDVIFRHQHQILP